MKCGRTALMDACRQGNLQEVTNLLAEGHDPNEKNENGTTPFMFAKTAAFGSGDLTILELLIAAGANVSAKDNFGKTAMEYAKENYTKIIRLISENAK